MNLIKQDVNKMNLIICMTPLHVLIAEKIIALYPADTFFGVFAVAYDSDKNKYYFNRLQQICDRSKYIILPAASHPWLPGKLRKISYFFRAKNKKFFSLPYANFNKVFLADINSDLLQIMLSYVTFDSLMTFDDGLANILPGSFLYQPDKLRKKNVWPCKNNYTCTILRNLSCKHYSIYAGYKNIVSPTEIINLMPEAEATMINTFHLPVKEEPIRILLGQPLFEPNWNKCKEVTQQIINCYQIANYFPHPRECYEPAQVTTIKTDLIFEEYLLKELTKNPDQQYEIYSTGSSAILTVLNFPHVTVRLIHITGLEQYFPWYQDLLDLIAELGIEKLHFSASIKL